MKGGVRGNTVSLPAVLESGRGFSRIQRWTGSTPVAPLGLWLADPRSGGFQASMIT